MIAYSRETIEVYPLRSKEGSEKVSRQYRKLMTAFDIVFNANENAERILYVWNFGDSERIQQDLELSWRSTSISEEDFVKLWKSYFISLSQFLPEQFDEGVSFQTLFSRMLNESLQVHLVSFRSMINMAAIAINSHSLFNFMLDLSRVGYSDFHDYAHRGAKYLDLHWKDIYHTLQERVDDWIIRKWTAVRSYRQVKLLQRPMSELEERGIQMANFAYDGKEIRHNYLPTIITPYIQAGYSYDPKHKAYFKLGYGLRGVLFTVKEPSPITGIPEDSIFLMFSGTRKNSPYNWRTDIRQYIHSDPVYFAALGFANYINNNRLLDEISHMVIGGHSLGGGLAQFSVGAMTSDGSLQGIGYNSAGLSNYSFQLMKNPNTSQFVHVFVKNDIVHKFGNHIGDFLVLPPLGFWAHGMEVLRKYIGERYYCMYN